MALGDDDDPIARLSRALTRAAENMPNTGQFASRTGNSAKPYDGDENCLLRSHREVAAARQAVDWLVQRKDCAPIVTFGPGADPPDAIAGLADGTTLHCEVRAVIDGADIARRKRRKAAGETHHLFWDPSPAAFQECLCDGLKDKERTFQAHLDTGRVHKPVLLVMGFDGQMSRPELLNGWSPISSEVFKFVLLHMGYKGEGVFDIYDLSASPDE